jgi:molybdate transport system substrate-binding protein
MRVSTLAAVAKLGLIALLAQGAPAMAAEVKVLAGAALRGAFDELVPKFEAATKHKLVIDFGATGTFKSKVEAGEAVDLVIIGAEGVDDLIKQGKIAADTRVEIARVGIGMAVRAGAAKPDISTVDAFKDALRNAKSITYTPEGAAGAHVTKVLDQLGIAEQLKPKTKANAPDRVPQAVAEGEAELAIASSPTLVAAKGVDFVGLLPSDLQSYFINTAGIVNAAKQPEAAKEFVKYLTTPEAAAVIKAKGMEPRSR